LLKGETFGPHGEEALAPSRTMAAHSSFETRKGALLKDEDRVRFFIVTPAILLP